MKKIIYFLFIIFVIILSGCSSKITVSFETNGGNEIPAIEQKKGEKIELPQDVSREGYVFEGWFLDENFTEKYTDQVIKKSVTLYAKWRIKTFTVKFLDFDENEISTQVVNYGESAEAPDDPVKEGYGFIGWDQDFSNVKSDLTIKAKFKINTYTVKFLDYEDNILSEQTINHGESADAPTAPVREGYNFVGWDQEFDNVKSDLIIKPQYEVKKLTVIFYDYNNNPIGDAQIISYGESAEAPDDPLRDGYDFEGWDQDYTNVTEDLIIKPIYTPIVYSIKYYDGDKELTHKPSQYTADDNIILKEYQKENHTFVGWFLDEEFEEEITEIKKGSFGNLELYGRWSVPLKINYELNGGSWTWTGSVASNPENGIVVDSNLPEIFMADFYIYLKENDLLTSSQVASKLHKTTWEEFKKDYVDPYAIYNHTTSNTSQTNDGYSQLFFETATGDTTTGEFITIKGGFLGTEPYKSKYINLVNHIAIMTHDRYSSNYFFGGPSGKSLAGFVFDGFFYGTQGVGTGIYAEFRKVIPNTNVRYVIDGTKAKKVEVDYEPYNHLPGKETILVSPFKTGHIFGGWYDNPDFNGDPIYKFTADVENIPKKLYAKWIAISSLE